MWIIYFSTISMIFCIGFSKPQGINLDPTVSQTGQPEAKEQNCVCVFFYLCRNNTIVTDGTGIITPRLKSCPISGQICCPYEDHIDNGTTTTTTTTTTEVTPQTIATRAPDKVPDKIVSSTPNPRTPTTTVKINEDQREGCGYHNPYGISYRIKGSEDSITEFGEFPWMVAIFLVEDETLLYKCGGSLIHPGVVMTAAHCVVASKRGRKFKIRAGDWDLQSTDEVSPHQEREVETVVMHKQYSSGTLRNDIALLFLKTPVTISPNVDVMCLPPKGTVATNPDCLASGWGRDKSDPIQSEATILRRTQLPMVPHGQCQESLRKSHLGEMYNLHSSFVCAGGVYGKDTCKGDGGSPLMCPIPNQKDRYQQIGIVSWGIGCGDGTTPSLFANVAELRDWIDEEMTKKQYGTKSYTY